MYIRTPYSLGKLIDWKLKVVISMFLSPKGSLLVREINWLETSSCWQRFAIVPDSLLVREINWLETEYKNASEILSMGMAPYSLGKLIDWKRDRKVRNQNRVFGSLLVREINWLETRRQSVDPRHICRSLLVREINWLETRNLPGQRHRQRHRLSLLVREINWLETMCCHSPRQIPI